MMYYECVLCVLLKRKKAESEAQRGKPKGTIESQIRIAISVLEQRHDENSVGAYYER